MADDTPGTFEIPDGSVTVLPPEWCLRELAGREKRRQEIAQPAWQADKDAPPISLSGDALERWYGRVYVPGPRGVDRSYSLWWLAVVLLEAGLAPAFVEGCLAERDVALGWTKFSGRRDAMARYHVIVERAATSQSPRVRLSQPQKTTPLSGLFLTARQIGEMEDEDIHWYAFGRVGAGLITELDGKAKLAGKTTLVLDLIHAIVYGEEFLGEATTYARVVYLTEQSGPSFKRNLSRAGLLDRDDVFVLLWNHALGKKWDDIVADTREFARGVKAGVLVVDTLAQFSGIRGDDENKSGAALQTMEPLHAATADGLAVLVNRHDRKSGGDVGDSGRGSSAYAGAVDIILHLQRLTGDDISKERQRLLDAVSRFEETPDKKLIEFTRGEDGERAQFHLLGDPVRIRKEATAIDIMASLPTNRADAPTFDELRKDLGMREIEVRRVLNELVAAGAVEFFDRPRRYRQVVRDAED